MAGLNAVAVPETFGIFGEGLHRLPLGIDPSLQRKHVHQLRAPVLSDIPKRKIADIHPMDDQRARDSQDNRRIVWTEFPILRKECDPIPLHEMPKSRFEERRGPRGQPYDFIPPRLAPDPDLHLISFAELTEAPGCFAVLFR
jgi:hypothetical protein